MRAVASPSPADPGPGEAALRRALRRLRSLVSREIQHLHRAPGGHAEPLPEGAPLVSCVIDPHDAPLRDDLGRQTVGRIEVISPADAARGRYVCALPRGARLSPIALETALFFAESYGLERSALGRHRSTRGPLASAPGGASVVLRRASPRPRPREGFRGDGAMNLVCSRSPALGEGRTILAVVPYLLQGGAERLLHTVTLHLASAGWRVLVCVTLPPRPELGDASAWLAEVTDEVFHLSLLLPEQSWSSFIEHLIRSRRVDVLWQMGSRWLYPQLPRLRAAHPQLAVVDQLFNPVVHLAHHRQHRGCFDAVLCENRETEQALAVDGGGAVPVTRIESGVDLQRFSPAAVAPDTYPDGEPRAPLTLGYFGRLSDEKNALFVLRLMQALSDEPGIVALICGRGAQERAIRKLLRGAEGRRGGLASRVRLMGLISDPVPWMRACDAVLLPSLVDGRPNTVLEALATGVPVLGTRVGAVPELVSSDVNGHVFDGCVVEEWAAVVRRLRREPETLRTWSAAARAGAEAQLDAARATAAYERFFRRVVQARRG